MERTGRVLAAIVLAIAVPAFAEAAPPLNLLADRPLDAPSFRSAERMTDGILAVEGDFWRTNLTATPISRSAAAVWDLGQPTSFACLMLQGDNDDTYRVRTSDDGTTYRDLWAAGSFGGPGLRVRSKRIEHTARFVELTASRGDGRYAVSEIGVYADCPQAFPEIGLLQARGIPLEETARNHVWMFGLTAIAFLLFAGSGRWPLRLLFGLVPLGYLAAAASALFELRPFFGHEPDIRAVVAAVAGVLALLEGFGGAQRPHPRIARLTLAILALLSLGCYFHFGSPQFGDARGGPSWVHTVDMRHYFPSAKYFDELRYDGLYLASLAAYVELAENGDLAPVADVRIRDLDTYAMTRGSEVGAKMLGIRARFTPERWQEFLADMKWFLESMGPRDYLGSITDHGGNATPVWLLGGWLLYRSAPASDRTLLASALIDPILLAILFVATMRTFGLRIGLYVVVLFGATDFYQFGSNLVGSTLRQDWLAALGLGICALAVGRSLVGGATLAYAGLIRAFPALAALALPVPIVWQAIEDMRRRRSFPDLRAVALAEQRSLRAVAGAALAVVVLMGASTLLFGARTGWGTWLAKMSIHATEPSVNNVGLRNVMAYSPSTIAQKVIRNDHPEPWVDWQRLQLETFESRRILFYVIVALAIVLAFLAARGRPPHQVAVLGLLLVPIFFYPSNYYCHFVFLFPLLCAPAEDRDRAFAWVVAVTAALCVAQYFTLAERWSDVRYTRQSMALITAIFAILIPLASRARSGSSHIRRIPGAT